jgi:tetratricopeptide (TPR) repeat protein
MKAQIAAIKNAGRKEFLDELKRIDSQLPEVQLSKPFPKGKIKWIGWSIAAAACMTGMIWLVSYLRPEHVKSSDQIYAVYYQPYRNLITSYNRSDEKAVTLKEQAMISYTEGDYAKAIEKFKEIKASEQDAAIHFYMANASMATGKMEEAQTNFLWVLKADILFIDQTKWFLALSYIKTNQLNEAKKLLFELTNHENAYKTRATEILNTIQTH